FVDATAIENENILESDHVAIHAGDLGNGDNLAGTVGQSSDLHDGMNGIGDLVADGAFGNIEIGHGNHVFDTSEGVAGRIGVYGGERTLVTGVHGLEHVKGFLAAHLADHDAIGAHTQAVDDELTHADGALAFDVGRRVSRRTTCSCLSCNSAASSMVT